MNLLFIAALLPFALAAYLPIAREAADGQYIRLAYVVDSVSFENVSWEKYTIAAYAFALADPNNATNISINGHFENGAAVGDAFLEEFSETVRGYGKNAILSFAVYDGFFSSSLADNDTQCAFADSLLQVVDRYNLSGVDFAWEDPNHDDEDWPTCSVNSTNSDAEVFLSVLTLLRQKRTGLYLSAAVGLTPFKDNSGEAVDLAPFADVLNHIAIMAYGIFGPRSNNQVGPNAPLIEDPTLESCASFERAATSAGIDPMEPHSLNAAVEGWQSAGMTSTKASELHIVVGVAAFGRTYSGLRYPLLDQRFKPANATSANFSLAATLQSTGLPSFGSLYAPLGDAAQEFWYNPPADQCGNKVPLPTGNATGETVQSGLVSFKAMVTAGYLRDDGKVPIGGNFTYAFDDCSQTPYMYDFANDVLVSYDDHVAMEAKGNYIKEHKLAGFAMWHAANDHNHTLVDAVSMPLGFLKARAGPNPQRM